MNWHERLRLHFSQNSARLSYSRFGESLWSAKIHHEPPEQVRGCGYGMIGTC